MLTGNSGNDDIVDIFKLYKALSRDQRVVARQLLDVIDKAMPDPLPMKKGKRKGHIDRHPPPRSSDGKILASSIYEFCNQHRPPIKYKGMRNAIDTLTTCKSPYREGKEIYYEDHQFHYDCDYRRDGVYLQRKEGRGYRTSDEDLQRMRRQAGFKD